MDTASSITQPNVYAGQKLAAALPHMVSVVYGWGLIRAWVRGRSKGLCHPPSVVWRAYLRWLHTQGLPWAQAGAEFAGFDADPDGWLVRQKVLRRQMAPGNSCLSALSAGGTGTVIERANDSKGCGAVMRTAQIGFFVATPDEAWDMACQIAAITHGHPDGTTQPACWQ